MNIPFPVIYPRLFGPDWFNGDQPFDEDAELTALEEENKRWLDSIGKQYMKTPLFYKPKPAAPNMEEPISVSDDDANEDAEETEDSNDIEEEEEIPDTDSASIIILDSDTTSPEDTTEPAETAEPEGESMEIEVDTQRPISNQNTE